MTTIQDLTKPAEKKVPLNVTVAESTSARLDKLTIMVQQENPKKKLSHVADQLLTEKLDELGITV